MGLFNGWFDLKWESSSRLRSPAVSAIFFIAGSLVLCQCLSAQAKVQRPAAPAPKSPARTAQSRAAVSPSLDALVLRVNSYWSLLRQNRKLEAMKYVESSDRQYFATRPFPSFSNPKLVRLEPATSGKEVAVTVQVKRLIPPLVSEVEYPVTNRWVFSGGNWWVVIKDEPLPMLAGRSAPPGPGLNTQEIEKRKDAIRSRLTFTSTVIDLGTVRKGHVVEFSIPYQLSGDQSMEWKGRVDKLEFLGSPGNTLSPGPDQRIPMKLLTQDLEGPLDEPFTFTVHHDGVEVTYEVTVRGFVYTPLSTIPSVLRYSAGETEKELVIRNNSKSEARFVSIYSESDAFEVKPLPQSVGPEESIAFKVRQFLKKDTINYTEMLSIKLAAPVDGMESVLIPVVTNAVERKEKSFKDLTPKDVEELIRKNRPVPDKP